MKNRRAVIAVAVLISSVCWGTVRAGEPAAPQAPLKDRVVGTWKLVSRVIRHPDGSTNLDPEFGKQYPIGYIMYDRTGHMAVQFMKLNRPDDRSSAGYEAYFGTYTVDDRSNPPTVTHHIEGSLRPGGVGKAFVRDLLVKGDSLTLIIHTDTPDVHVNSFTRVK
jgi:Lipocalin-like domain